MHTMSTEENVETGTAPVTPRAAGDDNNGGISSKKRAISPFINAIEHMASLIRTFLINSE